MKKLFLFILFVSIHSCVYAQESQYNDVLAVNGTSTAAGQMSPLVTVLLAIGLIALGLGLSYFLMQDQVNLPDNDLVQSSGLNNERGTSHTPGSLQGDNLGDASDHKV